MAEDAYLIAKAKREYKMRGRTMDPVGTMAQFEKLTPEQYEMLMVKYGETMFKKRPKYEATGHYKDWDGPTMVNRAKLNRDFTDELHRKYKKGKSGKVRGVNVRYG